MVLALIVKQLIVVIAQGLRRCWRRNETIQWSDASLWQEDYAEVYCEDCGSHPAVVCPECGEYFDMIYVELEERELEEK
jgi:hypothetical protein